MPSGRGLGFTDWGKASLLRVGGTPLKALQADVSQSPNPEADLAHWAQLQLAEAPEC